MKKILIKFPSRGRPEKFKSTLEKHIESLSKDNDIKFVFSFDNDDLTMNNDEIKLYLSNLPIKNEFFYGDSQNKIQAINANLENQDFDILILVADDMIPILKDYDKLICNLFESAVYGLDSILHFYTAMWADKLDIWCIMGKKYYDRFGYIYHPDYKSIFADNEYTEVSKILDRNIFSTESPFFHDYQTGDETEVKNWQFNSEDWLIFEKRKKINYDIKTKNENSNTTRKRKTQRKQNI